jgi:hypothetical protein
MTEHGARDDRSQDSDSLRARLRAGDPYLRDGGPLDAADAARLRQALRAAALERRSRRPGLGWTLAAASLTAALAVWIGRPAPPPPPGRAAGRIRTPAPPADSQLHFVTPGGTRVVWVLRTDDLKL